jgi:uncharacterized OB-fold protein
MAFMEQRPGERPAPLISARAADFWTGGADGELRIQRCQGCRWWLHPPMPMCPRCHGRDLAAEAAAGTGTVWSFTVNRYQWTPALAPPYVIAEVELDEQPGLRLLASVVGCDEVRIGMRVRAAFEPAGEAWVPVFTPVRAVSS